MMAGRAFVTPHAVKRWRARIQPQATYEEALAAVIDAFSMSSLKHRDVHGTEHWRASGACPWGRVRFRVRAGAGPLPAIVTVLPEHDDVDVAPVPRRPQDTVRGLAERQPGGRGLAWRRVP